MQKRAEHRIRLQRIAARDLLPPADQNENADQEKPDIGNMNWSPVNVFFQGFQKNNFTQQPANFSVEELEEDARIVRAARKENARRSIHCGVPRAFRTHYYNALFGRHLDQEQKRTVEPVVFAEGILTDDWISLIVGSSEHTNGSNRDKIVAKMKSHAADAQSQCLWYFGKVSQASEIMCRYLTGCLRVTLFLV